MLSAAAAAAAVTLRAGDDILLSRSAVGRVEEGARAVQAARVVALGGSRPDLSACRVTLYYHPEDTRFGRECFHTDYHEIFLPVNSPAAAVTTTDGARLQDASSVTARAIDRNHDRVAVLPDCSSVLKKVRVANFNTGRAAAAAKVEEAEAVHERENPPRFFCVSHYSWELDLYFYTSDFPSASQRAIAVNKAAQKGVLPAHYCHRCRRYVGMTRRGPVRLVPCPNPSQTCSRRYCNECAAFARGSQCCCSCSFALKCIRCRLSSANSSGCKMASSDVSPSATSSLSLEHQPATSPDGGSKCKQTHQRCTEVPLLHHRADKLQVERLHAQVLQRMALVGSIIRAHFVPVWPDGKTGCSAGEVLYSPGSDDGDEASASSSSSSSSGDTQPHLFECDGIIRAYSVATGQHLVEWLGRHQRIFLGHEVISVGPEQEAVHGTSWLTLKATAAGGWPGQVPARGEPANAISIVLPPFTPPIGTSSSSSSCAPDFVAEADLSMYLPENFKRVWDFRKAPPRGGGGGGGGGGSKLQRATRGSASAVCTTFKSGERPPTSRFVLSAAAWLLPDEQLHCICRRPEYLDIEAVECVKCKEWFHAECLGVTDEEVDLCMDGARDWYCAMCDLTRTDDDAFAKQTALAAGGRQEPRATPSSSSSSSSAPSLGKAVKKIQTAATASHTPKPAAAAAAAAAVAPTTRLQPLTTQNSSNGAAAAEHGCRSSCLPMTVRVPAGAKPGTELLVARQFVPGLHVRVFSRGGSAASPTNNSAGPARQEPTNPTVDTSHTGLSRSAVITRMMTKESRHSVDRVVAEVEFDDGCREIVPVQRLSAGPPHLRVTVPEGAAPGDELEIHESEARRSPSPTMESLDGWEVNATHWSTQEQRHRRTHHRLVKHMADAERRIWAHLAKCAPPWVSETKRARAEGTALFEPGLHVCTMKTSGAGAQQATRQMRRLAAKLLALYRDNLTSTWAEFERVSRDEPLECSSDECKALQFSLRRFCTSAETDHDGFMEWPNNTDDRKRNAQHLTHKSPLTVFCPPDPDALDATASTATAHMQQQGRSSRSRRGRGGPAAQKNTADASVAVEQGHGAADPPRVSVPAPSSRKAGVSTPLSRRTSPRRARKGCALCQASPGNLWSQRLKAYICQPCQHLGNSMLPAVAVSPESNTPNSTRGGRGSRRLSPWGRAALARVAALEKETGSNSHNGGISSGNNNGGNDPGTTASSKPLDQSTASKLPRPPLFPSQGGSTPRPSKPVAHSSPVSDGLAPTTMPGRATSSESLQTSQIQRRINASVPPADLFTRAMLTKSAVATEHVRLQEHHDFFKEFFEGFDNPVVSNMRQYRELERWRRKNMRKHNRDGASTPLGAQNGPPESPHDDDKAFYGHSHPQLLALLYEWTSVEKLVEPAKAAEQVDYVFAMRYVPQWRIRQVPLSEYPKHLRHDPRHVPHELWESEENECRRKAKKAKSSSANASSVAAGRRNAVSAEPRRAAGARSHQTSKNVGRAWTPAELRALDIALAAYQLATLGAPSTATSDGGTPETTATAAATSAQQVSEHTWKKVAEHVNQAVLRAARANRKRAKSSSKRKALTNNAREITPDDCRVRYEQGLADRRLLVHYKCMYFFYKNDWRLVPITKTFTSSTPAATSTTAATGGGAKSGSTSPESKSGGSTTPEGNVVASGVGRQELELLLDDPAQRAAMVSHPPSRVGQALARLVLATTASFVDPFEADAARNDELHRIAAPHFELPADLVAPVAFEGVSSASSDAAHCGRVFAPALHRGDGALEISSGGGADDADAVQQAVGLGSRVQGFWQDTEDWYDGVVTDVRTPPTELFVQFDDGDASWLPPAHVRHRPQPLSAMPQNALQSLSIGSAPNCGPLRIDPCRGGSSGREGSTPSGRSSPRVLPSPVVGEVSRSSPTPMSLSGAASPSQLSPSSSALAAAMLQRNALGGQFTDVTSNVSAHSVDHQCFAATATPGCSAPPSLPFKEPSQSATSSSSSSSCQLGFGPESSDWFVQAYSTLEAASSGLGQRQWWGKDTQDSAAALELKLTSAQNSSARRKRSGARFRKARAGASSSGSDCTVAGGGGSSSLRSTTGKRRASARNAHDAEAMAFGGGGANGGGDLVSRQKRLRFGRSPIHAWGVYADEPLHAGDFVLEYKGELIRKPGDDVRMRDYTRRGMFDYMFRVNDDLVCDATCTGSLARFLNHSCDGNCHTRIVNHGGKDKIFIHAKRDIDPNEELTYDYKFPFADAKIPCRCGAVNCRGFMN